jgi:hypothetical protein
MKITTLLACCGLLLLSWCTSTELSGPATEEGNPVLAGVVLSESGKAASNAAVTVYRHACIVDSSAAPMPPARVAATRTDGSGRFAFHEIVEGEYALEAVSADSGVFGAATRVSVGTPTGVLDTIVMRTPGAIRGVVTRGGRLGGGSNTMVGDGFIDVILAELHRSAVTDQQGRFELKNVPEGAYTLLCRADDGFLTAVLDSVRVFAGTITEADTVRLIKIPWLAPAKPFDLTAQYDRQAGAVTLRWNMLDTVDIIGYQVERRQDRLLDGIVFPSKERSYVDTLDEIVAGMRLYYVVRAVNGRLMTSANEGPVEVAVE